jgi:hypothetical protein
MPNVFATQVTTRKRLHGNCCPPTTPRSWHPTENSGDLARVYDWDGDGWLQRGGDINGERYAGWSVSISSDGNVIAIGTLIGNGLQPYGNVATGHARIYEWDGNNWLHRGQNIYGDSLLDFSDRSVSLTSGGDVVAILRVRASAIITAIQSRSLLVAMWWRSALHETTAMVRIQVTYASFMS